MEVPPGAFIDLTSDESPVAAQSSTALVKSDTNARPVASSSSHYDLTPPVVQADDDDEIVVTEYREAVPTTIFCIGQVDTLCLVLYPLPELNLMPNSTVSPLMAVILRRQRTSVGKDTIKVSFMHSTGKESEPFGVVEHRVANVLGTLWDRSIVDHLEATVVRAVGTRPMMLPMRLLLFCQEPNVDQVSSDLALTGLQLKVPDNYNPAAHNNAPLHISQASLYDQISGLNNMTPGMRMRMPGMQGHFPYGAAFNRTPPSRNVDDERKQLEEIYSSLRSGVDLEQVDPSQLISTCLYPYQKQALSFLLHRERQVSWDDVVAAKTKAEQDDLFAMWKAERDSRGKRVSWRNVITSTIVDGTRMPPQTHGAIIADDMGLGKTLIIISLIATTRESAFKFAIDVGQSSENNSGDSGPSTSTSTQAPNTPDANSDESKLESKSISRSLSNSSSHSLSDHGSHSPIHSPSGLRVPRRQSSQQACERVKARKTRRGHLRSRATLVVCPLSTVRNWESQIEEHTNNVKKDDPLLSKLKVYIYHGSGRTDDINYLANNDVVITTFGTLGTEFSRSPHIETSQNSKKPSDSTEDVNSKKRKKPTKNSPLQQIEWFRVVLDEAHMIKEHSTIQAQASCSLEAKNRICLTGTPIQNSLNDLFSLVRFLRLEPFVDRSLWTQYIGRPVKFGDPLGTKRLQLIMRAFALRRTKTTKDSNGDPILKLPPKDTELRYIDFEEREGIVYKAYHQRYKKMFHDLEKKNSLLKNYCHILQEILFLRQISAEMHLIKKKNRLGIPLYGPIDLEAFGIEKEEEEKDLENALLDPSMEMDESNQFNFDFAAASHVYGLMKDTGNASCCKCGISFTRLSQDEMACDDNEDSMQQKPTVSKKQKQKESGTNTPTTDAPPDIQPIMTKCLHVYCAICYQGMGSALDSTIVCFVCERRLTVEKEVIDFRQENGIIRKEQDLPEALQDGSFQPGSKIKALIADLLPFSAQNPYSQNYPFKTKTEPDSKIDVVKSVVFSQWTSLLDRIELALDACKIKYKRLDGSMARYQRVASIDSFNDDKSIEVLLISIKAGGVGLNLTVARRIYLMEPNWNPAVEHQAQDRVHRLGQKNPVSSVRFIMRGSIEENMLKLQQQKLDLATKSLTQTLSKKEMEAQRMKELRVLFEDIQEGETPQQRENRLREQQQQPQKISSTEPTLSQSKTNGESSSSQNQIDKKPDINGNKADKEPGISGNDFDKKPDISSFITLD